MNDGGGVRTPPGLAEHAVEEITDAADTPTDEGPADDADDVADDSADEGADEGADGRADGNPPSNEAGAG